MGIVDKAKELIGSKSGQTPVMNPGDQDGPDANDQQNTSPEETDNNDNQEKILLKNVSDDNLKVLKKEQLNQLCKDENLPCSGIKDELIKRLFLKKYGHTDRYIRLVTKCRICHASIKVTGKKTNPQKDGSIIITRQVCCTDRHHHSYQLTEVIPAPKPDEE